MIGTDREWLAKSVEALIWLTQGSSKPERKKVASFFDLETDDLKFLQDLYATITNQTPPCLEGVTVIKGDDSIIIEGGDHLA